MYVLTCVINEQIVTGMNHFTTQLHVLILLILGRFSSYLNANGKGNELLNVRDQQTKVR